MEGINETIDPLLFLSQLECSPRGRTQGRAPHPSAEGRPDQLGGAGGDQGGAAGDGGEARTVRRKP